MNDQVKQVATLSNSSQSTSIGIPENVSTQNLEADFADSFLSDQDVQANTQPAFNHEMVDIYSTLVG